LDLPDGLPKNQNQRHRRGIFVDYIRKSSSSSEGATYSDDAVPERSFQKIISQAAKISHLRC
jgi:DNA primase